MAVQDCYLRPICNGKDCEADFCLRKYKMDSLYTAALIPENKRKHITLHIDADGTDFNEFTKLAAIESDIENFVKEGRSLFLHSEQPGNGKSSWAYRCIEAYFNKIWPGSDLACRALFVSVPKLLVALKDNIDSSNDYAKYIKEHVYEADLVVWDDICNKMGTEYEINQLLNFIDPRIVDGKANIYTSNLGKDGIYTALGERLGSRICNLSVDIELKGKDKRALAYTLQTENKGGQA